MAADRVLSIGCGQLRGAIQQQHLIGKPVPVDAAQREHHIHARAAQFLLGNQAQAIHHASRVPFRFHPHQIEGFGLHGALVADGLAIPEHHAHLLRHFALLFREPVQHGGGHFLAEFPGFARGQQIGIEVVEVAPRGQAGRRAQRVARHPAGLEPAAENRDQARQFPSGDSRRFRSHVSPDASTVSSRSFTAGDSPPGRAGLRPS